MSETFVVGDVHGCRHELEALLAAADFRAGVDRLACVGDLVNRGPDSRGVLELVERLGAECVRGNHEQALLRGKASPDFDRLRRELGAELDHWLRWIDALPAYRRYADPRGDWYLLHGGVAPGLRPETTPLLELLNLREVAGAPWYDAWQGPETVIFGHWAMRGLVDRPLVKGLDSGCVYGKQLTGLWWPRGEWVSVPAERVWHAPSG